MQLPTRQKIGQTTLEVDRIRRDGGTQPRVKIDQDEAREVGEAMREEGIAAFDAVVVFWDGTDFWLADGFKRVIGARLVGLTYVRVDVREGTRRDAILYSAGANARPGVQRRNNEDKRFAVMKLLNDEEWRKWSDREIARHCVVDHKFVGSLRSSLGTVPSERTYTTKHGTVSTMNTANIGHSPSAARRESRPADGSDHDGHDRRKANKSDHQPPAAAPAGLPLPGLDDNVRTTSASGNGRAADSSSRPGPALTPAANASPGAARAFHPGSSSTPVSGVAVQPASNGNGRAPAKPAPATAPASKTEPARSVTGSARPDTARDSRPDTALPLADLLLRYDAETRVCAEKDTPDTPDTLRSQRQEMARLIAALRTELAAACGLPDSI